MTKEQALKIFKFMLKSGKGTIDYWNGTIAEQRAAIEMAIKALEQQQWDDVMAIHTQGLDEGIRCAMCTNSMRSDRGCDGGCVVNEDMYKKVMETINNQMFSQPTSDDCVSRKAVIEYIKGSDAELGHDSENEIVIEDILNMPPVTPTQKSNPTYLDCQKCENFRNPDYFKCKNCGKGGNNNAIH